MNTFREMAVYVAILVLILVIFTVFHARAASFYGESYIHLPFQNASSTTEVRLQFKTHRPHGLLLLAAGETDYISVELQSGIIEAKIDLGSGEALLHSPVELRLDDLQFHEVTIIQDESKISLMVDDISQMSARTPGEFFELNVEDGIFLGGIGTFTDNFYGNFRNFRGCLQEVYFNGYDILSEAQQLHNPLNIFEISWMCDDEFDAASKSPISFMSDTSFAAFPHLHIRTDGTLSFDIKTRTEIGILLFNSGRRTSSNDFIALELMDGKIKLSLDKGSGIIVVQSPVVINDAQWHQIDVTVSTERIKINVDQEMSTSRFDLGDKRIFDLEGHLFIGGVGVHARASAMRKGLVTLQRSGSGKVSIQGCIRNIVINSRHFGFHDIQVSRLIEPSCLWSYPCASAPCIDKAECIELDNRQFQCKCDLDECVKNDNKIGESEQVSVDNFDVLAINELRVDEGAIVPLTTNNIDIIFDFQLYNLRESSIQFRIKVAPKHGQLEIDLGRRRNGGVFTMLDLIGQKVSYVHDNTDTSNDDITIEMEIYGESASLPLILREKYEFVLPIIIFGTNDPPTLAIGGDGILHIIENSKIIIIRDILSVADSDSLRSDLQYHVTYQSNVDGYFERSDHIGVRIASFTQEDIDAGAIWFVHHGASVSYYRLHVSDGILNSNVEDLKVVVVQLHLRVTKNTGLSLPVGTSALIHSANLTVSPNVPIHNINVSYEITEMAKFGEIQKKQADNSWLTVAAFSQSDIQHELLRYKSKTNEETPTGDMFKFVTTSGKITITEMPFNIKFQVVTLDIIRNKKLILEHKLYKTLSKENLLSESNIQNNGHRFVIYNVLRPPTHIDLYRTEAAYVDPRDVSSIETLSTGSTFTQREIQDGRIGFRLRRQTFEIINDFLDFRVTALTANRQIGRFRIEFIPQHTDIRFTNNGLDNVIEGGQEAIEKNDLYLEMDMFSEFEYSVIVAPEHGELMLIDERSGSVLEHNIRSFTNQNIRNLQLVYKHDDSENNRDSFMFIATPVVTEVEGSMEITEFTRAFEIRMIMRNDNPPTRLIDKVFNVVTNKERVITIDDIAFSDPDIGYDPSQLQFTFGGNPNGKIIFSTNRSDAFQFTQQDIIDCHLIFQHSGPTHGRATMSVTDGQFYTTSLFEVQASDPYIKIVNNTGILVRKGSESFISSHNLSIETNIHATTSDVRFVLIEEPLFGSLTINDREVLEFSLLDIITNIVFYKHDGSSALEDEFGFVVFLNEVQTQDRFPIRIYLESFQYPPKVVHNGVLEVVQGGVTVLTKAHLHVGSINSTASDIVYSVLVPPSYGRLHVDTIRLQNSEYLSFTQEDINYGRIVYTHRGENSISDRFIFDVSNSKHFLRNLEFRIEIVTDILPLQVKNITVREGGRKALTPSHLKMKGRYLNEKSVRFIVIVPPEHGRIESVRERGVPLTIFSSEELQEGNIYYAHDDSDFLSDSFILKSQLTDQTKESEPKTIHVEVMGINDEVPRIVVNKELEVWSGSITLITSDNMRAEDPDTPAESVVFNIATPTNGHLALLNNTFKEITSFTQAVINSRQLVFVHRGSGNGEFSFQVSDGAHSGDLHTFHVYAKPLILTLISVSQLNVYPNTIEPITMHHLSASTNNEQRTKPIIFAITTKPRKGKVVTLMKGRPLEVTSFTQEEVNQGHIYYEHNRYIHGWQETDYFMFDVSTLYAESVKGKMFEVSLSYANINEENKGNVIVMNNLVVDEGAEKIVTKDYLDVSVFTEKLQNLAKHVTITFTIDKQPVNGRLYLAGLEAGQNKQFTQEDINMGDLKYVHDHSDTTADAFPFTLGIQIRDHSSHKHAKHTSFSTLFNITVIPVNDQPFKLITTNPSIQVIQSMAANITDEDLKTIDADTESMYIQYSIVKQPSNGFVAYRKFPALYVSKFTQADIDNKHLIFIHDGSEDTGTFHFKVSDGAHSPYYKDFNIYVIPIALDVVHSQPIKLLQAAVSVYITSTNINVTSNGFRRFISFNVTDGPKFGNLYVQDHSVTQFKQTEVDMKKLIYIQTDRSSGTDSFVCGIHYQNKKVNTVVKKLYNITVIPLLLQNPLVAPIGSRVAVTRHELDASELRNITGDNPKYYIKEKPKFGRLVRDARATRQAPSVSPHTDIDSFTHEDIVYWKVFYISDNSRQLKIGTLDNFTYVLSARNVQPAEGTLTVKLSAPESSMTSKPAYTITTGKVKPSIDETDISVSVSPTFFTPSRTPEEAEVISPQISNDFVILLAVLVPLLVLIIIVILVVFFLVKRRRYQDYYSPPKQRQKLRPEISRPYQIQQPHVHIQPQQTSPSSDEDHSLMEDHHNSSIVSVINEMAEDQEQDTGASPMSPDLSRTEVSPTVPMCKVTPLLEKDQSHKDLSDSTFDWTLLDPEFLKGCSTATPVLRKDQYWV